VLAPGPAARTLLLCLGEAKSRLCLLAGSLELPQALRAGGPRAEGPRLVQLVALAGVSSLGAQIVQVIGWHEDDYPTPAHSA